MEKTKNYGLNKPASEDFYNVADFNENADILDKALADISGSTGNYQSKPVTDEYTLLAASWNTEDKSYSFESDYPNAQYDIVIELDGGAATEAQTEAWDSANIKGNYPENILYAKGDLPAVDIPVIRQVIKK